MHRWYTYNEIHPKLSNLPFHLSLLVRYRSLSSILAVPLSCDPSFSNCAITKHTFIVFIFFALPVMRLQLLEAFNFLVAKYTITEQYFISLCGEKGTGHNYTHEHWP